MSGLRLPMAGNSARTGAMGVRVPSSPRHSSRARGRTARHTAATRDQPGATPGERSRTVTSGTSPPGGGVVITRRTWRVRSSRFRPVPTAGPPGDRGSDTLPWYGRKEGSNPSVGSSYECAATAAHAPAHGRGLGLRILGMVVRFHPVAPRRRTRAGRPQTSLAPRTACSSPVNGTRAMPAARRECFAHIVQRPGPRFFTPGRPVRFRLWVPRDRDPGRRGCDGLAGPGTERPCDGAVR